MKKRIVSLLLALVMAVSLLPVSAFAVDDSMPDVPVAQSNDTVDFIIDLSSCPYDISGDDCFAELVNTQSESMSIESHKRNELSFEISKYRYYYIGLFSSDAVAGWKINEKEYVFSESQKEIEVADTTNDTLLLLAGDSCELMLGIDAMNYKIPGTWTIVPIIESDEGAKYTPSITSADAQKGTINSDGLVLLKNTEESSIWNVTATPKAWYKLDYVADEAGNKFASEDGKTARITVTAADQKFTAYFTSAIAPLYDETDADSVTVNVTISNDGIPLMGKDGTILANLDVTVPYFDLDDYGLSKYYRYGTEYGWGSYNNDTVIERPTALHAYIYLIERYYMGLPASQCGKGTSGILDYNKATDVLYMDGEKAYNTGRTYALTPTGDATSLYMFNFWGHDQNLMYYRNHEYPLMGKGWGSTCDYILLSDGDRLDVGLFTNWDFYKDGGFNQFSQDAYTVMVGETVTTSTFKAGTSAAENGESPELEAIKDLNVAVYDANWNKVADLTGDGTYSYAFTKAGTYYIMGVDANAKTSNAHYAPAITKVTVEGEVDEGGTFILRNANEMLLFQNYVNNGHPDAKAVLGADINMTGIQWSGINGFTGTFDGAGHTLTVALTDTGLFNDLAGTVKNLTVAGTVSSSKEYIGAITSTVKGNTAIENCTNKANVTNTKSNGSGYAGGIVGGNLNNNDAELSILNCRNYGEITSNYNVGGILGIPNASKINTITKCENHGIVRGNRAGGITSACSDTTEIRQCLNNGTVTGNTGAGGIVATGSYTGLIEQCVNTGTITSASGEAGGIAGYSSSEINSCYNTGAVSGNTAGGIVAWQFMDQLPNTHNFVTSKVSNCYTTGTVTGSSDNALVGAAVGKLHMGNIVSVEQTTYRDFQAYALEGTCAQLVGQKSENAKDTTAFKTAAELKSDAMLTTLGDAFKKDAGNINNGYPVLVWQVSEACTDHTPGAAVRENEVPATCTKDGSHDEVIYCTVCKTEISRKTITDKALGHDWDSTTGKCKRCETACDHKWTNGKCDTCGYTCQHVGGDAVKEKEVPATCTKDGSHDDVVYCTICKAEVSRKTVTDKALGHKEQPAVKENVKAPTCTVDGSHDEVVYCSVCKEEVSRTNVVDKATGHKWDDGVVTTQPTTGKEGVKTFTCTVCKETKTESVPKLGEDKKDESAANDAINLINGIGTVTKNSKDKIDAARKAYDGLTEDQKKLVPDSVLKTLTDAEAAYAKLTKPGTKPGNNSSTSTDTKKDDGKTVKSGQTGDAGIVLYAAMGLLSLTGGALVLGKKKKQD